MRLNSVLMIYIPKHQLKQSISSLLHPETKDTLETWKEYYSDLGVELPQTKLGINPGIMSLSEKIEIIHFYGIPDGMKK